MNVLNDIRIAAYDKWGVRLSNLTIIAIPILLILIVVFIIQFSTRTVISKPSAADMIAAEAEVEADMRAIEEGF